MNLLRKTLYCATFFNFGLILEKTRIQLHVGRTVRILPSGPSGLSGFSQTVRILPDCQDPPVRTLRTVRILPDCQDPPGLSGFSQTVRILPDCQDPPDTCSYAH